MIHVSLRLSVGQAVRTVTEPPVPWWGLVGLRMGNTTRQKREMVSPVRASEPSSLYSLGSVARLAGLANI